jgi:hypothetical protein
VVAVLSLGCNEVKFLEARDESGFRAEVAYKRTLPFLTYDADLVIWNPEGVEVARWRLLVGRDAVGDLEAEIKKLAWSNGHVVLDIVANHYSGPNGLTIQRHRSAQ